MAKLNCRAQSKPDKLSPKPNFKKRVVSARLDNKELIYKPETYCLELEKQLAAMKYSWQELYEFAPIGYLDLDKNNCILKANLTSTKLFQIPRSRLIGKRLPTLVSKNSHPVLHMCLQQASAATIKQSYEIELLRSDGSSFYSQVECTVIIDPASKLTLLRLAIVDVGERRLAKQMLKCSEEKFRSIVEATKEWIWTIDLKGRYLYSNPAVTNILGYSVTELLGYNRLWLIHKEDLPVIVKMLPLSTRGKRGWNNLTLRWRCKDGSYRYLESNAVPFFDTKGTLLGFRGTERDVTLRKQVEEQTRQQQAAVHQASKINSLGELASALAHELAQPLTAINNFITGCIRRLNSNTNQKKALLEALQQAAEQAERAGQIIHRMKNFIQYGKLHCEKVDINSMICESISLIKKEFPSSAVKISFESLKPRTFITADKIQLEQVMLNLMRNSIEIMTDYAVLDPQLHIGCIRYDQHVLIKVTDNGPGFCFEGDLNKLFEACFTTKVDGLGIGLAISRTIIEAHGGHLRAYRRAPDKGACFQITLPIKQEQNDK